MPYTRYEIRDTHFFFFSSKWMVQNEMRMKNNENGKWRSINENIFNSHLFYKWMHVCCVCVSMHIRLLFDSVFNATSQNSLSHVDVQCSLISCELFYFVYCRLLYCIMDEYHILLVFCVPSLVFHIHIISVNSTQTSAICSKCYHSVHSISFISQSQFYQIRIYLCWRLFTLQFLSAIRYR